MSAHVLEGFLPWTVDYLKSNVRARQVWDLIFPPEVTVMCPTPVHTLGWGSFSLRWPLVAVSCLMGILGGVSLGAHLLLSRKRGSKQGYFMWGFTFIWYALMCLGALFTHSINSKYFRVFYLMDVIATGCTGVSSVGGFLCAWKVIDDRRRMWQIVAVFVYGVLNFLALTGTPFIRDQVYIVPTAFSLIFFVHHRKTFGRKARSQELVSPDDSRAKAAEKWLDLGAIGAILALASLAADRLLCRILGSHGSFLVWVFIGCDIALVSAYKFITVLHSSPSGPGGAKPKTI